MNSTRGAWLSIVVLAAGCGGAGEGGGGGGGGGGSPGSLVTGFGAGGAVRSDVSAGSDRTLAIAVDADSIYLVGVDSAPGNNQWRIEKRSRTSGQLVAAFGTGGVITVNPSVGVDVPRDIAINTTHMFVAGSDASPGNDQWRIEKRLLTTGALDTGFDADGVLEINPSVNSDVAAAIAIDGTHLYVAGSDSALGAADTQWRIEKRLLSTGAPDLAFDGDGVVVANPTLLLDDARDIAIDGTSMYAAGFDSTGGGQWRIEKRSLTTGLPDAAFDGDGVVESNPSVGSDACQSLAIDSMFLYAAGFEATGGNVQWRIEKRSLVDGSPDLAFDTDGFLSINPSGGADEARSIVVDATAIYVAGFDASTGNDQWRIEKRSLTSGAPVATFDTDGVVESNPSAGVDQALGIALASGSLYIVGFDNFSGTDAWRAEKRDATSGAADATFGSGAVTVNPGAGADEARSIFISTAYMFVAGVDSSPGNNQWRMEKRLLTTGALDTGFDGDGIALSNPSVSDDQPRAIVLDAFFLYVVGFDSQPGAANAQWRIEKRLLSTGALDPGFDGDGIVLSNPGAGNDVAFGIAIDATSMYVVGSDTALGAANAQWRIEKRSLTTGALDPIFGPGTGVVTIDPSGGNDIATAIAIGSTSLWVAGTDSALGVANPEWRVEKMSKTTGAADVTFGGGFGFITSNPSGAVDTLTSITGDGISFFIAGAANDGAGDDRWRIERRDPTTGGLLGVFGGTGIVETDPGPGLDAIQAIGVDSSGLYLCGIDTSAGDDQWRIERRSPTTGLLDASFDGDGIVTSNPSVGSDVPFGIAADSASLYIAGRDAAPGNAQWRIEKRAK